MSGLVAGKRFARLAALAEIFLVLALGNIVGVAIYEAVVPAQILSGDGSGSAAALYAGLRIFLRIGFIATFGLALLWFRRGATPRDAGLTRAGKPLSYLVGVGVLLGGFSSFLVGTVFAVHAVVPLGEGLAGWQELRLATRDTTFYVELLATSIIVPPLVEEIMARGYMRLRLVESYGRIGGVILTGLVFAFSHGKFISTDPLLAISMILLVVSSISWAYIAQTTGSVIPPMIAHAMTNTFATVVLFDVWAPFGAVIALVLWQRRPIIETLRQFLEEWRAESDKVGLWFGVLILVLIITTLLIAMSRFGRMPALLGLGTLALLITIRSCVGD